MPVHTTCIHFKSHVYSEARKTIGILGPAGPEIQCGPKADKTWVGQSRKNMGGPKPRKHGWAKAGKTWMGGPKPKKHGWAARPRSGPCAVETSHNFLWMRINTYIHTYIYKKLHYTGKPIKQVHGNTDKTWVGQSRKNMGGPKPRKHGWAKAEKTWVGQRRKNIGNRLFWAGPRAALSPGRSGASEPGPKIVYFLCFFGFGPPMLSPPMFFLLLAHIVFPGRLGPKSY